MSGAPVGTGMNRIFNLHNGKGICIDNTQSDNGS